MFWCVYPMNLTTTTKNTSSAKPNHCTLYTGIWRAYAPPPPSPTSSAAGSKAWNSSSQRPVLSATNILSREKGSRVARIRWLRPPGRTLHLAGLPGNWNLAILTCGVSVSVRFMLQCTLTARMVVGRGGGDFLLSQLFFMGPGVLSVDTKLT